MSGQFITAADAQREQLSWGSLGWVCRPAIGAKDLTVIEVTLNPGGGHTTTGSGATGGSGAGTTTQTPSNTSTEGEKLGAPYPVVLCHGFFGFEEFAGAGDALGRTAASEMPT